MQDVLLLLWTRPTYAFLMDIRIKMLEYKLNSFSHTVFVLNCVVFDETSNFLIYPTMVGIKGSEMFGVCVEVVVS